MLKVFLIGFAAAWIYVLSIAALSYIFPKWFKKAQEPETDESNRMP
jgi:hypothetical protein